jgi:D-glycero-alpha-D-manno-heptose 1-phosphate guanylyltransferase
MKTDAIILAGGFGTRLQTVVADVPKPMAPVNNKPFLAYLLDYWAGQGIQRFILSTGYKGHIIREYFGDKYKSSEVIYAPEDTPLGTGGALLNSLPHVQSDDFLFLNGDTFFNVILDELYAFHKAKHSTVTLALKKIAKNDRYGAVSLNSESEILKLNKPQKGATPTDAVINGGVMLFNRNDLLESNIALGQKPMCLEDELFVTLKAQNKKLYGYATDQKFLDIGIPEDYYKAASFLEQLGVNNT